MRNHVLPLVIILCALSSLSAHGASTVPKFVTEVEGIQEYRLANGLQVLLFPDASKPTITVNVTYHVGSRMENYGETGMAHLLEHLMFRRTSHRASVEADLSGHGMSYEGQTNEDRTNYYETFPADAAQLSWALALEAERMTGTTIAATELTPEMTVVRNEMESGENDPINMLLQKTTAVAYEWHNYGKSTIGARSDVENVNVDHLRAFYRKYYQPDNATLIVAGAFDVAKTLQTIGADFEVIPKPARVLQPTYTVEPVQEGEREVTLRRVGSVKALVAAYHVPSSTSDSAAAFEVIVSALADAPSGRLHKRLVEGGKATQIEGWVDQKAEPRLVYFLAVLKTDDALVEAQATLLSTIEGLNGEPITPVELGRAQKRWDKWFRQLFADPERLCVTLSESIAAGDWRLLFMLRDRVKNITVEQVNERAQAWFKSSNRTLGRFIPEATPSRVPLAVLTTAQEALKDWHPGSAVAAGEFFDASPANLDARTHLLTLPCGLQVAFLPKKTRGETIKVQLNMHFGTQMDLERERVAGELVPRLLTLGTASKTREQIQDGFDAIGTEWSVEGNAWGASARLSTTRPQLATALNLLADVLRHPSFPAGEFEQLIRQQSAHVEAAATDPGSIAWRMLARSVRPYTESDVRYTPTFDEQTHLLKSASRESVVKFYERFWGANTAQLAIVGDFDEGEARSLVTSLLGDWKSASPYTRVPQPAGSTFGQRLESRVKDKANAYIIGALPLAMDDTDPDYPALFVAVHVLGDGFDSRLLHRIRVTEGLSYGVGAWLNVSNVEPSGILSFYGIFAPQNRERIQQAFAQELTRWVAAGVSDEELVAAKAALSAGNRTRRANDQEVAGAWPVWLELHRTYAFEGDLEKKIAALTRNQVNAAVRKWIDPVRINWSVVGDFP
jgi:zinc protease